VAGGIFLVARAKRKAQGIGCVILPWPILPSSIDWKLPALGFAPDSGSRTEWEECRLEEGKKVAFS